MVQCIFASCNNRDTNYTGSFFRLPRATADSWFSRSRRKDISIASLTKEAKLFTTGYGKVMKTVQVWQFSTGYGKVMKTVKPGEVSYRDGEKPPLEMSGRLRRSLESPQNKICSTSSSTSSVSTKITTKNTSYFINYKFSFMNEMCYHSILSSFNQ